MKKEQVWKWTGIIGTGGTMLFSCLVCGGVLGFISNPVRKMRLISLDQISLLELLASMILLTAAFNLVYCSLSESIRIRWEIVVLVANILVCFSAVSFHFFLSHESWDTMLHFFALPALMITVAFNLVFCRICRGIRTDWVIVLPVAFILVYFAAGLFHLFQTTGP
jgi:hypothetical protein